MSTLPSETTLMLRGRCRLEALKGGTLGADLAASLSVTQANIDLQKPVRCIDSTEAMKGSEAIMYPIVRRS